MNIFCKKLKKRGVYAIKTGDRQGGFIVWIKECDTAGGLAFLFMPSPMEAIFMTEQEVREGLKSKYLEFVQSLPVPVYEVCVANWKFYAQKAGLVSECKKSDN